MNAIKLVFEETTISQKAEETTNTLVFKGSYGPSDDESPISLRIGKCSPERAVSILEYLEIEQEGETIYIIRGKDPQKKLDEFFPRFIRRKEPKMDDFLAEITDFDDEQLRERNNLLQGELREIVNEGQTGTKKFDVLFDCYNALRLKLWGDGMDVIKEQFIAQYQEAEPAEEYVEEETEEDEDLDDDEEVWDQE